MPIGVLTLFKLVVLAGLYLFLARVVRVIVLDLYGPRRKQTRSRQPVAASSDQRRVRRHPRELVVHHPNGKPQVVGLNGGAVTLGRSTVASVVVDDAYVSDEQGHAARGRLGGPRPRLDQRHVPQRGQGHPTDAAGRR